MSEHAIDPSTIRSDGGWAWYCPLPFSFGDGDSELAVRQSALWVFEDERPLGPAHTAHDSIRKIGQGGFSHWAGGLRFSTSDNVDPRKNGRRYVAKVVDPRARRDLERMTFAAYAFPQIVAIETLNVCNARCPFCPLFQGDHQIDRALRPATVMKQVAFEALVAELAGWPLRPATVFLNTNGEPLLDPLFEERLRVLRLHKLAELVDLQTNGELLRDRTARAILDAGIRSLVVGFDGATKEVYEAHRVRCSYERVMAHIRRFVELRDVGGYPTRVDLKFVRTRENQHEVRAAFDLFNEFTAGDKDRFVNAFAVDWSGRESANELYLIPRGVATKSPDGCELVEIQMNVMADGVVSACCWDYNLDVSEGGLGSASDAGLLAVWRGAKRESLRERMVTESMEDKPNRCRSCPHLLGMGAVDRPRPAVPENLVASSETGFTYRFTRKAEGASGRMSEG